MGKTAIQRHSDAVQINVVSSLMAGHPNTNEKARRIDKPLSAHPALGVWVPDRLRQSHKRVTQILDRVGLENQFLHPGTFGLRA